ncbi:MAG: hypothetical protein JWM68_2048 [Verrucomicrobiales bacterium]|nr:hypothetical protein [Verrucomicrobiales bacterium]
MTIPMKFKRPNQPDAAKPAITSRLHSEYHWHGLADPER